MIANSLVSDMQLELEQVCGVLIESILKYKKQYARKKDFEVINDLAIQILKRNE